jgi:hypothetical protein
VTSFPMVIVFIPFYHEGYTSHEWVDVLAIRVASSMKRLWTDTPNNL